MSESAVVQSLVDSIIPLVNTYSFTEKQTPTPRKNECRWEIGRVLSTATAGEHRKDAPLLRGVSLALNARFHRGFGQQRLGPAIGEVRKLSSLSRWRDVEHLREYCLGDISIESECSSSYQVAFDRGIKQLVRHVSQHGIPPDAEIDEDARFLLARASYNRDYWDKHENRSCLYVAGALKSLYWQVLLWEENGRSARDLDEASIAKAT